MDKHLLAENPMSGNGNLAIIRTIQPISIYEVVEGHVQKEGSIMKHYRHRNSDNKIELYTLRAHHYFTLDVDSTDTAEVYKFMDDAWFWFSSYLKWEDSKL